MFRDNPKTNIITTKDIMNKKTKILTVYHEEDGFWQFLDNSEPIEFNSAVLCLEEIVKLDETVLEISDLPLGYCAWRRSINDRWIKAKIENEKR